MPDDLRLKHDADSRREAARLFEMGYGPRLHDFASPGGREKTTLHVPRRRIGGPAEHGEDPGEIWIGYTSLDSFVRHGRYPRKAGRDGRSEASRALHRGVQAADGRASRRRQAAPWDHGRARSRPVGPTAPDQRHQRSGLQPAGNRAPEQERVIGLERGNRRLEMEVDVSKQAAPILARRRP